MNFLKKLNQKIMRNLQGILLLLFSVFLFNSCDNTEIPFTPVCNYEFTNATANATAEANSVQDINFSIKRAYSESCETPYTMAYTVKRDGNTTSDGIFTYSGTVILPKKCTTS